MPLLSSSSWHWSIQYEHRQKAKDESKEEKKGKSRKNAQPKLSETNRRKIRFVSRKQKIICISPNLAFQNDKKKKNFFVCAHRNECSCSSPAQRSVRKRKGKKETESGKERKRERETKKMRARCPKRRKPAFYSFLTQKIARGYTSSINSPKDE